MDAGVGGALSADKVSIGGQAVALGISFDSARRLTGALLGYDPALLVLGVLGVFNRWIARRSPA